MKTVSLTSERSMFLRSSIVMRHPMSFFGDTIFTEPPRASKISLSLGAAIWPVIMVALFVVLGSFSRASGTFLIAKGEPIKGSSSGVPVILREGCFAAELRTSSVNSWILCGIMPGIIGALFRISPFSGKFANLIRIAPFAPIVSRSLRVLSRISLSFTPGMRTIAPYTSQ